jgi:hypothetical protein
MLMLTMALAVKLVILRSLEEKFTISCTQVQCHAGLASRKIPGIEVDPIFVCQNQGLLE